MWITLTLSTDRNGFPPQVKRDDRVLVLDDCARPRQRWRESLANLNTTVPKDWDVLLLGW